MDLDLIDFSFGFAGIEIGAKHLAMRLCEAGEAGRNIHAALQARLPEIRHLQAELDRIAKLAEGAAQ